MATGLSSGVSGLALGTGLYKSVSGLWSGASGLLAGFGGASLNLDFLTMTAPTFDPRITFSRGSQATLVDATGNITYAPNNLVTYSEQFDNAAWYKGNTTVTADQTTAPDGTLSGDKVAFAAVANANIQRNTAATVTAGVTYIYSVWAKADSSVTNVKISLQGVDTSISIGTSWTRFYASATASGATLNPTLVTRDSVAVNIYLWGAQLEAVTYQTTPSTYVATTSTAYYGPRFDYDPSSLAAKGLLVEEQRTNLVTYSDQFDNAAWTKTGATVTANTTTSPDGTANADTLVEDTSTGVHRVYATPSCSANTAYTYTVFVKAAGRTQVRVLETTLGGAYFDLSSGSVLSSDVGVTASIQAQSNGFYRCRITATTGAAQTLYVTQVQAAVAGSATYTGTGIASLYLWGAQLEAGSFATSYIPTVASTVTRSADVAAMTGTNFSGWYNQAEGSFVVDSDSIGLSPNQWNFLMSASSGAQANSIPLGTYQPNAPYTARIWSGGAVQASMDNGSNATINSPRKMAVAYALDNFAFSVSGNAPTTDASGSLPVGIDRLSIGDHPGGTWRWNGHIRTLSYYPSRLSNTQLQAITT